MTSTAAATTRANTRPQHLCIRPLTIYDLKQVLALESKGFPESERASEAQIKYRLTVCPELCSGLFVREFEDISVGGPSTTTKETTTKKVATGSEQEGDETEDDAEGSTAGTKLDLSSLSDSDSEDENPDSKYFNLPPARSTIKTERLIGQIMGTKTYDDKITTRSMQIPKLTADNLHDTTVLENDKIGHVEDSRTLGIHSVVVDPEFQGLKLGSLLIKDYLQKLNQQFVVDRVVLLAHDSLVKFYKNLGFEDDGASKCQHGGENWRDMSCVLTHEEDEDGI
ncbi:unnamed protein product [Ambrosiozyma monospora]|uniref:Unnamed protein product n=1 Tax=Ambrosiozyma monospora TaxID=43982 RepID=A0A9W6Z6L0_AMBMO|nr:unnamed protein product [Ambrosiozyma monospora]